MKITMRGVVLFISIGLLLAFIGSSIISKVLSSSITGKMANREVELILGAIEAGPLTIARLQSSAISQQGLKALMNNPSLENRNLRKALIEGGPNFSFTYASWDSAEVSDLACLQKIERVFQYPEALNPFKVTLERDVCSNLPEAKEIFFQSVIASLVVTVLAALILSLSVWPVATSLRLAELSLDDGVRSTRQIRFIPILKLVERARYNIKLEKQAALAGLARQVAHDIRSPLSALNIFVRHSKSISEEEKGLIENVSSRINEVANNLLQSNTENSLNSSTDLLSLVRSVYEEKRIFLAQRPDLNIEIIQKIEGSVYVNVSKSDLARVLSNLINNSIDAILAEGRIQISIEKIESNVQVSVSDNGCGMSEEVLNNLGQQDFTTKHKSAYSGSGLGFWHAKQVIESAAGRITVRSKVNVGTTITLLMPMV